jgi:putative hemolysin
MECHPMQNKFIIGVSLLCLFGVACAQEKNNPLANSRTVPAKGLANPAAIKCIEDGYVLKPIEENGAPRGYFCVNKETGSKCEIWSYFRGECDLSHGLGGSTKQRTKVR